MRVQTAQAFLQLLCLGGYTSLCLAHNRCLGPQLLECALQCREHLHVLPLHLEPLRDRPEDIPRLWRRAQSSGADLVQGRQVATLLLDHGRVEAVIGFVNSNRLFDIDPRQRFAASIFAKGGRTETLRAVFMRSRWRDTLRGEPAPLVPVRRSGCSPRSPGASAVRWCAPVAATLHRRPM